jgi:1,2-diacylglycerol 3-alpha-glucosyltransferase
MNIVMMTNTYTPFVGGVTRSVESFTAEYRKRGLRVLVVAPKFENMPEHEGDVLRVPAIQNFNGSDFSVVLAIPREIKAAIEAFGPELVHAHHPFLLGDAALRLARARGLPLVFTHHTMYEEYTHYVPGDSRRLRRFAAALSTSYANMCDQVFAPSESVARVLRARGVETPVAVVPTGIPLAPYEGGSGQGMRAALDIPEDAFVVGHVGRLAAEKNLTFLAEAVIRFLERRPEAHFLVVGSGPLAGALRSRFAQAGFEGRLHMPGTLRPPLLVSAYKAMDVFAFASHSETQGMVVTEAMAAGTPVVALDARGVREVVRDGASGRLLGAMGAGAGVEEFAQALDWVRGLPPAGIAAMRKACTGTAAGLSIEATADMALARYAALVGSGRREIGRSETGPEFAAWNTMRRVLRTEWMRLKGMAGAAGAAFAPEEEAPPAA